MGCLDCLIQGGGWGGTASKRGGGVRLAKRGGTNNRSLYISIYIFLVCVYISSNKGCNEVYMHNSNGIITPEKQKQKTKKRKRGEGIINERMSPLNPKKEPPTFRSNRKLHHSFISRKEYRPIGARCPFSFALFSSKKNFHRYATRQEKKIGILWVIFSSPQSRIFGSECGLWGERRGGEEGGKRGRRWPAPLWLSIMEKCLFESCYIWKYLQNENRKEKHKTKRVEVAASSQKVVDSLSSPVFRESNHLFNFASWTNWWTWERAWCWWRLRCWWFLWECAG